ncbi:MAG TPA: GNAT family N-acetyltransferase [Pyrinomonadaceae bacterium]|nr:GNAT family N-acetyltransferase [Pyrinomonadaceae bacterium]
MENNKISTATIDDILPIKDLINSAFRGEFSKKGWTTEAGLIEGGERIDLPALQRMMENPNGSFKKYTDENGRIIGCVYLEIQGNYLYLGTLTVSPEIQAQGIGKKMLNYAEEYAIEKNCYAIVMWVVSLRQELIDWYLRHGYYLTGETKPFPTENKFGTPTRKLEFVVLKKAI